ncbi:hypothetical protein MAPG_06381 [Magnaporthiopsis poae ATCC 64411]|uniref:Aminoglycoside phosphotransferase domain-containing protein n=1 Tax=Magnaporthiopsis poae (strain ATCC 64411 / 73-15) TaxID=644358 RepID=A0A0C4E1V9_MAGP6|nr:hypothetical protein MAPG_06381 [Magnaporthiopsis poae ATCC 64411]
MSQQIDMSSAPVTAQQADMRSAPTAAELEEMYPTPIFPTSLAARDESLEKLPVGDCIREVLRYRTEVVETPTQWIVGGCLLLTHHPLAESPPAAAGGVTSWPGGERDKGYYTLQDAPQPLPWSRPVRDGRRFEKMYERDDHQRVVLRIGEAVLKAKIVEWDRPNATREHVNLKWVNTDWVREYLAWGGVDFPQVLHHHEVHGRYFLFLRYIHGQTLEQQRQSMTTAQKVAAVVALNEFYLRLRTVYHLTLPRAVHGHGSEKEPGLPRGLDGNEINRDYDRRPHYLDLDHGDMCEANVLVDKDNKVVAVLDWEATGLVSPLDSLAARDWALRVLDGVALRELDDQLDLIGRAGLVRCLKDTGDGTMYFGHGAPWR